MKVSLNWIKEYADIKVSANELVDLIGKRLGTVEDVVNLGERYNGIVIVKVVSCESHPNADKLQVCLIDDGGVTKKVKRNKKGFIELVCGGPNARQGLLATWLPPGAAVPDAYDSEPVVLDSREVRGVMSHGMLGTPRELGINQDHEGVMEIDLPAKPGDSFAEIYQLDDTIIELENKMFTHRPDCFGILGVARELAGIQHLPFKSPDWYLAPKIKENSNFQNQLSLKVFNKIPNLVPRFMAVAVDNIKIGPSPYAFQSYLTRVGIRPVNNIVDITNYVMYLTAQPMHAFDYHKIAKLSGKVPALGARLAKKGEMLTVLGGKQLTLTSEDMVLTTDKHAADLAGIMGGADSEVDEDTTAIILSCCTFDMYTIRRTAMRHGVFTEAATRYTKGQSPLQNDRAMSHALQLIAKEIHGRVASKTHDLRSHKHEAPIGQAQGKRGKKQGVKVTADFINQRLGSSLNAAQIKKLLEHVEFSVELRTASSELRVRPPFWRTDIEIPEDIVEEVGRLYGYDRLPIQLPMRNLKPAQPEALLALKKRVRQTLARAGANEVLTYSFVHGNLLTKAGQKPENSYQLANALSPELQYYRQTLTPSLLDKVRPNTKAGQDEFVLFELNKAHNKIHGLDHEKVPGELNMLALTYTSKSPRGGAAYYRARAYLDYLLSSFGLSLDYAQMEADPGYPVTSPFDHTRSALVTTRENGVFIGMVGEYKAEVVKNFKLPAYSAGFEIGTDHLLEAVQKLSSSTYKPLPTFPKVEQDMTLRITQSVSYGQLTDFVISALTKLLPPDMTVLSMDPLTIFQKGKQYTHITYHFQIASYERTLTDQEVNGLLDQVAAAASKTLQAERV